MSVNFLVTFLFIPCLASAQTIPSTIGEIFNFSIGDTFEYQRSIFNVANSYGCNLTEYDLIVVRNKILKNDSLFYEIHSSYLSSWHCNHQQGGTNSGSGQAMLVYANLDSSIFSNLWRHAFNDSNCETATSFCHSDSVYFDSLLNNRKVNRHWEGVQHWVEADTSFAEGLGLINGSYSSEDIGEEQGAYFLIYYHKANGEKWGYPHYFSITSQESLGIRDDVNIAPNPVIYEFFIRLSRYESSTIRFKLYDSCGRLVKNKLLENVYTRIARENLNSGIYYWEIEAHNKSQRGKLFFF